MHTKERLLNPREVAELLGISVWTLAYWRRKGTGGPPWVRLGPRTIRYDREALVGFLGSR
jgi:predicted DNA-binding transcriptional regulator AlpA